MSRILEEEIYGKVATPKKKIIGEFIEKYIILALIPWIIYRIGIYIITDVGSKAMQEEQFSISSILNYYNIANELSYKIFFFYCNSVSWTTGCNFEFNVCIEEI